MSALSVSTAYSEVYEDDFEPESRPPSPNSDRPPTYGIQQGIATDGQNREKRSSAAEEVPESPRIYWPIDRANVSKPCSRYTFYYGKAERHSAKNQAPKTIDFKNRRKC